MLKACSTHMNSVIECLVVAVCTARFRLSESWTCTLVKRALNIIICNVLPIFLFVVLISSRFICDEFCLLIKPPMCDICVCYWARCVTWSNCTAVSDRSTADHNCIQYPHAALPHLRRFRISTSHVSESRDPDVLPCDARSQFPHATYIWLVAYFSRLW